MAFQPYQLPYTPYQPVMPTGFTQTPSAGVVINVQQGPGLGGTAWGSTMGSTVSSLPMVTINGRPVSHQLPSRNTAFPSGRLTPSAPLPLANTMGLQGAGQLNQHVNQLFQWAVKEFQEAQLARMMYMSVLGGQTLNQGMANTRVLPQQQAAPLIRVVRLTQQPLVMHASNVGMPAFNNGLTSLFQPIPPAPPIMMPLPMRMPAMTMMGQNLLLPPTPVMPQMPPSLGMMPAPNPGPVSPMGMSMGASPISVPPWQQPPMAMATPASPNNLSNQSAQGTMGTTGQDGVSPFPNALPQSQLPQLPINPDPAAQPDTSPKPEEASVVSPPTPETASNAEATTSATGQPVAANDTDIPPQGSMPNQPPVVENAIPMPADPANQQVAAPTPTAAPAAAAQPPGAANPTNPQTLEEFPLYQELAQKETPELQGLLRDILSIPNEQGQVNQLSPHLYSLQTIEFILFILRNRPDAAVPETYGLLKQLKDMGLVMATINDTNIEDWKKKDSEVILMEALWAGAKLDSFQPPTVPLDKLPGYSSMIKPILTLQEKVPPLIMMAAVQAVSPDMFARYNEVPKKTLTKLQDKLTSMVNRSGKRKWWTLGLSKYPTLSEEDKAIYLQTRDLISLILNGASLNNLPGMAPSMPPVGMAPAQAAAPSQQQPPVMIPMQAPVQQPPSGVPSSPAGTAFPEMSPAELQQLVASLPPDQQQAIQEMQQQLANLSDEELKMLADQMMTGAPVPGPSSNSSPASGNNVPAGIPVPQQPPPVPSAAA